MMSGGKKFWIRENETGEVAYVFYAQETGPGVGRENAA